MAKLFYIIKVKTMGKDIGAETAKLAGLQIDMLQKLRSGKVSLQALEWWLNQSEEDRQIIMRGDQPLAKVQELSTIDCDKAPFLPDGWKVEEHKKMGSFKFDPSQVKFHLSDNQKDGKSTQGHKLRKELEGQSVMNANVLDYLFANQHLIPEDWKKDENGNTRYIFFWGTIYRNSNGNLYVRSLFWLGYRWLWRYDWLGNEFSDNNPAAVRA